MSMVNGEIASDATSITPSDTATNAYSYIYVGGTGNVNLKTEKGTTLVISGIPAGSYIWVRTSVIFATNTTATNLVGFTV